MRMWTFLDLVTDVEYVMERNPNTMSSPLLPKSINPYINTNAKIGHAIQGKAPASEFTFGGNCRTEAFFNALVYWSENTNPVRITDHLGRSWDVVMTGIDVKEKKYSAHSQWRFSYEMKCLVLAVNVMVVP